jgi:REP element-mobilizing transposase RayT
MANTFTSLHFHIVFSTKNRERWLDAKMEEEIWRYLGGICRAHKIKALQIGGVEDHVHLLLGLPPTLALSNVVKRIKGESSKWLSSEKKDMAGFAWQEGYGAFTIGKSQVPDTIADIQDQRKHHRKVTFEDEYRKFLHFHEIEAEEKFLFG